ncbi:MAG: hypothetical protein IPP66_12880 [Anaerolineales bacterium]|nr:hypothetical protein [Anaerolineales bacterium]
MNTKDEKKIIKEKPMFLLPLPIDEIMNALLQGRQQPKKEKKPKKKMAKSK